MMKRSLRRMLCCLVLCASLLSWAAAPAAAVSGFSDVPDSHWAADSIRRCAQLGFLQGETATRFGVGHQMTRAAFTVALSRFFGWKAPAGAQSVYDDVPTGAWYASAVAAAYTAGALTLQSSEFRPGDPITREEAAVMLVRALGYGTIAGLAQDLDMPFRDVTSNAGYIAVAHELGLVSGTSATAFSPERTVTREQAAVMLMRLYDGLHAASPGRVGIADSADELTDLAGYEAVAVAAGRLIYQNGTAQLVWTLDEEVREAVAGAAEAAGAQVLLYVSATENILRSTASETAAQLAQAVESQGWDGVFLDVAQAATSANRKAMTAVAAAVSQAMGDRLFYLMAEAPAWSGTAYDGYDYAALAEAADRLVLRVADHDEKLGTFRAAPLDPLEEVYYALASLRDQAEKVSLLITTTAGVWTAGSRDADISGAQAARLQKQSGLESYFSSRYACDYLTGTVDKKDTVVWYLGAEAVAERVRMAAFFGVDQVCLSSLNGLWPGVEAGLA